MLPRASSGAATGLAVGVSRVYAARALAARLSPVRPRDAGPGGLRGFDSNAHGPAAPDEISEEERLGERLAELVLDEARHRPSAEDRIEPPAREPGPRL